MDNDGVTTTLPVESFGSDLTGMEVDVALGPIAVGPGGRHKFRMASGHFAALVSASHFFPDLQITNYSLGETSSFIDFNAIVLASGSPVLYKVLKEIGGLDMYEPLIILDNVSNRTMELLCQLLYTGVANSEDEEQHQTFIALLRSLGIVRRGKRGGTGDSLVNGVFDSGDHGVDDMDPAEMVTVQMPPEFAIGGDSGKARVKLEITRKAGPASRRRRIDSDDDSASNGGDGGDSEWQNVDSDGVQLLDNVVRNGDDGDAPENMKSEFFRTPTFDEFSDEAPPAPVERERKRGDRESRYASRNEKNGSREDKYSSRNDKHASRKDKYDSRDDNYGEEKRVKRKYVCKKRTRKPVPGKTGIKYFKQKALLKEYGPEAAKMFPEKIIQLNKKGAFRCVVCGQLLPTQITLLEHRKKFHPDYKPHKRHYLVDCPKCGKTVTSANLKNHMRAHEAGYSCDKCGKKFTLKTDWAEHTDCLTENEKPFPCTIENCESKFRTFKALQGHMSRHNLKQKIAENQMVKKWPCSKCGRFFRAICNLKVHLKKHALTERLRAAEPGVENPVLPFEPSQLKAELSKVPEITTLELDTKPVFQPVVPMSQSRSFNGPYECTVCGLIFPKLSSYRSHRTKEHADFLEKFKKFCCAKCPKRFRSTANLDAHMKAHDMGYECTKCGKKFTLKNEYDSHTECLNDNEKPFQCTMCDTSYRSGKSLATHMKTHEEKGLVCEICGKSDFPYISHLNLHREAHNKTKTHECPDCHKLYPSRSSLKAHARLLHGNLEKKFSCHICGWKIHTRSLLVQHVRIHTGEKPHECKVCGAKFRTSSQLSSHKVVHSEKTFNCEQCSNSYPRIEALRDHVRASHTGERPYECNICGKTFTSTSLRSIHMRNHRNHRNNAERLVAEQDAQIVHRHQNAANALAFIHGLRS